ncbi:MAG: Flp pilus assembly complex ATPase component TadA [Gemmatimonadaceae bacterium]|jgi:type II secretory ATPase GspE/PulE/Tfp pilus assembly ATPase PilB-like protein|nr:Flp pilus assembly complex ATPase component TadA [Gemmatimonadaceae bacterium]
MAARAVRDEWLLPTLEAILPPDAYAQLSTSTIPDSYWESAVRKQLTTDDEILTALASRFRMKLANLAQVSQLAKDLVPEALARKYRIIPLSVSDSAVDIATADPHDLDCERTLAFALGRTVRMSLASPVRIAERIEELYRPENAVEKILEGVQSNYDVQEIAEEYSDDEFEITANKAAERPIIRLVDHIVAEGITSRASDIHLEPEESGVAVRYRIDGVLRQVMGLPRAAGIPLVSRIKIMAGLDIADRLRPQDGRARVAVNGVRIDLRVSTLPASNGEKVVIRILDSRATVLSLDQMGLHPDEVSRMKGLYDLREGLVLVTGPTGSGKTTTLYSGIRYIQQRPLNIVTIEDPVEYKLQGIVQVQVNEKAGVTFAAALRSILRQDPDVVLVGEIRDKEAAQIAVQASLTGHLVLSTLHTIDAPSAVTRLLDVGVESYKIATALKGVIAQRLIRRLCTTCRELWMEPVPERLRRWIPEGATLYRPVGCPDCSQTGYRGRLAITEVLVVTPEVERRIAAGESGDRIADAAKEGGMKSLWESGVGHVKAGITSLEELLRVVEVPMEGGRVTGRVPVQPPPPPDVLPDSPRPRTPTHNPVVPSVRVPGVPFRPTPRPQPAIGASFDEGAFQLIEDVTAAIPGARRTAHQTRVLLVEDEEPLRRVVKDLLEREGFVVSEAGDGVAALDEIDRSAPDIVVLDLNLPRLDGYGVLSHLRARQSTANLPVIVLTAKGDEDSEVRVFEFGANDYLTKPFRPRALSARLHALLKRSS